jgi:hypothetical protein
VQEGVAWFSDPGQGGPPDDDLEVQVVVVEPDYRGTFKDQSYPLSPTALTVHQGDVSDGYVELTNSGAKPWVAGTTKLAPIPRDKPSPFADSSWLSTTRVSTVAADVAPGAVGRFPLKLDATKVGDFEITLGLVEEGVTWFADFPKGGGPADGFLKVHLVVKPAVGTAGDGGIVEMDGGTPGSGSSSSGSSSGGLGGSDVDAGAGDAGSSSADAPGGSSAGCGCTTAIGASRFSSLAWAALAGLVVVAARRRRLG